MHLKIEAQRISHISTCTMHAYTELSREHISICICVGLEETGLVNTQCKQIFCFKRFTLVSCI